MLKDIELSKDVEKSFYKKNIKNIDTTLNTLQQEIRREKVPVLILFEGWEASGKGTLISTLIYPLDPRGFKVYTADDSERNKQSKPITKWFFERTPEMGQIVVFDKGWYDSNPIEDILAFERQLVDSGVVILKYFLHISKKEQKERFKKLLSEESTSWRVTKEDLQQNKKYDHHLEGFQTKIEKTDVSFAPWHIIEATHEKFAELKVKEIFIQTLQAHLGKVPTTITKSSPSIHPHDFMKSSILKNIDLSLTIEPDEYDKELKILQKRFRELEHELYIKRRSLVIVFEGWDAAGKGGAIRRLTENLDPRGYEVIPIAAPSGIEKAHHYLWRFWSKFPKAGHISIFDRSWYGRVLVERVENFCPEQDWKRAFTEINEMEASLKNGDTYIIKFWLHIDKEEQLRRFEDRQLTPSKTWKITDEDWRNREKWDQYEEAVDEMLIRTSTSHAPWVVIESNDKRYARIKVLRETIKLLES